MLVTSYGFEFDTSTLPEKVVANAFERYFAHKLGNEVAAKITAWKESNGECTEDQVAQKQLELRAEMARAILDGSIGTRAGGPRKDPLEAEMERVALVRLRASAKKVGTKLPAKLTDEYILADGRSMTLRQMIDAHIAKNRADVEKIAKRNIAEAHRAAAQAPAENSAEAFGL